MCILCFLIQMIVPTIFNSSMENHFFPIKILAWMSVNAYWSLESWNLKNQLQRCISKATLY